MKVVKVRKKSKSTNDMTQPTKEGSFAELGPSAKKDGPSFEG
jgi:hypothetical protein